MRNPRETYGDSDIPIPNTWMMQMVVDEVCSLPQNPEHIAARVEDRIRERLRGQYVTSAFDRLFTPT
jgi:hypothetical protein